MKYADSGANPPEERTAIAFTNLALTDLALTDLELVPRWKQAVFKYPRHLPTLSTSRTVSPDVASRVDHPVNQTSERGQPSEAGAIPPATVRRLRRREYTKAHQQTLQQRLQHRIEVAQAKGDRVLLQQLEQELLTLTSEAPTESLPPERSERSQ